MRAIESIETEKCSLEVIECDCGFHLGIDATYLDQVDGVDIECPSCRKMLGVCAYDEGKK